MPTQLIAERYEVIRPLGQGAFIILAQAARSPSSKRLLLRAFVAN